MKVCKEEGCDKPLWCKDRCTTHYQRFKKHGDASTLEKVGRKPIPVLERFWTRVNKSDVNECWEWLGGVGSNGYGKISVNRVTYSTHRMSWYLTHGKWSDLCILHSCDNRRCVNPQHLREGTNKDNTQDAVDRDKLAYGERNPTAKLTNADVHRIKYELLPKGLLGIEIAMMYNVTPTTISGIKNNRWWKHI